MCPGGEIGRRNGLKIRYPHGCVGSIPTPGTNKTIGFRKKRPSPPIGQCDSSVTGDPATLLGGLLGNVCRAIHVIAQPLGSRHQVLFADDIVSVEDAPRLRLPPRITMRVRPQADRHTLGACPIIE